MLPDEFPVQSCGPPGGGAGEFEGDGVGEVVRVGLGVRVGLTVLEIEEVPVTVRVTVEVRVSVPETVGERNTVAVRVGVFVGDFPLVVEQPGADRAAARAATASEAVNVLFRIVMSSILPETSPRHELDARSVKTGPPTKSRGSVANPARSQASQPPTTARAPRQPAFCKASAARALVASDRQAQ